MCALWHSAAVLSCSPLPTESIKLPCLLKILHTGKLSTVLANALSCKTLQASQSTNLCQQRFLENTHFVLTGVARLSEGTMEKQSIFSIAEF